MPADLPQPPAHDIRMRGFAQRTTVEATLAWVDQHARPLPSQCVSIWQAAGRVLATDIVSTANVPAFARSMMDGYAVRGGDTLGASAYNRLPLLVIGESLPGKRFSGSANRGETIRIMTGAPLPQGTDAVLPAEQVETEDNRIFAQGEVPTGKNVGQAGEDVATGTTVLHAGRVIRPQDLGLLSSLGHAEVEVVRQPRVRLIITGNELLPAGNSPAGVQIADANGPMLASLVQRDGGQPLLSPTIDVENLPTANYLVPDDPAAILAALRSDCDIVIVSGGSSVGQEDHAPRILAEHGELAIHGIAMRPSSPTGMGLIDGKLIFLLPGNPVSCLCAYDFFAGRAIRQLGGRSLNWPYAKRRLPLARKLVSQVGRLDYARVRIVNGQVEPLAISGASILTSTTIADGFVVIPEDSEGYAEGTEVELFLYDRP